MIGHSVGHCAGDLAVESAALAPLAAQGRDAFVDDVIEDGAVFVRVGAHEPAQPLRELALGAAGVGEDQASEARHVEAFVGHGGGDEHGQPAVAERVEALVRP